MEKLLKKHAEKIDAPENKKSPTAPTVGLRGRALTGQGKENKAMEIYYNQLAAGK